MTASDPGRFAGTGAKNRAAASPQERDGLIVTLAIIAAAVLSILPNYYLFATDDLATSVNPNGVASLAANQAVNGRFVIWAVVRLLSVLQVDYPTYQALGGSVFVASLLFLAAEIARFLAIRNSLAKLFGALLLFTSCLSLDLYQFRETYLCFGLAFLFSALAIRCAGLDRGILLRIGATTFFAVLAIGTYQTAPQIFVMVAGLGVIARLVDMRSARPGRDVVVLVAATILGMIVYLAISQYLTANVDGFASPEARPIGVQYVLGNLGPYLLTAARLMLPIGDDYQPLLNPILSAGLAILWIGAAFVFSARVPGWRKAVVWLVMACAFIAAPNPANLLLQSFWPTPRSAQGVVFFFAGIAALLVQAVVELDTAKGHARRAVTLFLGLLVLMQVVNDAQFYGRRSFQQTMDFILARQIVSDIERLAPATASTIDVEIVGTWFSNAIFQRTPYSVGISLFGTHWSAHALLTFVSGGRIMARKGNPKDCPAASTQTVPTVLLGPSGKPLVCFPRQQSFTPLPR